MKQIINECDTNIIDSYIGKNITVFCCRYIYTGKLTKIDERYLAVEGCKIVYETGSFPESKWADAQSLETKEWVIALAAMESFGILNKS